MRDFSIALVWAKIQGAITVIGGWLGYFLGGLDGLMIALVVFVILDYVTGIMCAINDRKLSSAVGFRGICRKVLIFLLDRKSTRLNSSHEIPSRMPSSA